MLLLYILWDDWPIFYDFRFKRTVMAGIGIYPTKPDCHSWWISKIQSDTLEERCLLKFCFELGKNNTKAYGMLHTAFGPSFRNRASVFEWLKGSQGVCEGWWKVCKDKEVNTPELIGQRVRVMVCVTMLRF